MATRGDSGMGTGDRYWDESKCDRALAFNNTRKTVVLPIDFENETYNLAFLSFCIVVQQTRKKW